MPTVTQQEYDALKAQIAHLNSLIEGGERQVVVGDESVLYNTTDSLIKARDDAQTRLNNMAVEGAPAPRRRPRQVLLAYGGRGY